MGQSSGGSLQQIRQETEQSRADLIQTVEQLRNGVVDVRERMRPATLKSEVTNYVRSRGEQWLGELKTAARENPLRAVAVCGGLAYPALRLMRAVPAPLLMVGAGLYLAGSREGTATDESRRGVGAGDATAALKDVANQAADTGQRYVGAAKDTTESVAQSAKETAFDLKDRATRSFAETLEQNPLLVAGVGLLMGGLIASALPHTELEDDLLGETSRSVKRQAQLATSRGVDAARDAAGGVARRASEKAKEEGIDPDGVRDTVRDVGERVRRVAEAAVTTAFELPQENDQSDHQGASSHD